MNVSSPGLRRRDSFSSEIIEPSRQSRDFGPTDRVLIPALLVARAGIAFFNTLTTYCSNPQVFPLQEIKDRLYSNEEVNALDQESQGVARKVHELVVSYLQVSNLQELIPSDRYFIIRESIEELNAVVRTLRNGFPDYLAELMRPVIKQEVLSSEEDLHVFVERFNRHMEMRDVLKKEAISRLRRLRKKAWILSPEGKKHTPIADDVSNARKAFYLMYTCEAPEIKEKALFELLDILECDPLRSETAFDLVDLQKKLLTQIEANQAENLYVRLQRLLIKAYARTLECILLHSGFGHLNACDDSTREQIWTGAEQLAKMNISDGEIRFWTSYAIQGAQRIRTNVSITEKWLQRIALITRAGLRLTSLQSPTTDAFQAISESFNDLKGALHHIEWQEDWFKQILVLMKSSRFSLSRVDLFRNVAPIVQECKRNQSDPLLLYGIVTMLEHAILRSPVQQIREEALKLLLQYISVDSDDVQSRVLYAINEMTYRTTPELKNTATIVLELLHVTKAVSQESSAALLETLRDHAEPMDLSSPNSYYPNVVKFLLRRLCEIKREQDYGGHSLVTLLSSSEEPFIPDLLNYLHRLKMVHVGEADVMGRTVYHLAALHNNVAMIQYVFDSALRGDINAFDYEKLNTALHYAVLNDHVDIVEKLLTLGALSNIQNQEGSTPLHLASEKGNIEIRRLLLKHGGDLNAVPACGDNLSSFWQGNIQKLLPIEVAMREGKLEIVAELIHAQAKGDLAHLNQEFSDNIKNRITLANLLAEANLGALFSELVDTDRNLAFSTNSQGQRSTPLHVAAANGHTAIIKVYAGQDDLNVRDYFENSAVHLAAYKGKLNALTLLLEKGAAVSLKNYDGRTPLHLASAKGYLEEMETLIHYGAQCNEKDGNGNLPLHLACKYGKLESEQLRQIEVARFLLNRYPEISENVNEDGKTPLHVAASNGRHKMVSFLIEKSACMEAKDSYGATPLISASVEGHTEVVNALLASGANIWATDDEGENALHKAVFNCHTEIVQALIERNHRLSCPKAKNLVHLTDINQEAPLHELAKHKRGDNKIAIFNLLMNAGANLDHRDDKKQNILHWTSFQGLDTLIEAIFTHQPYTKVWFSSLVAADNNKENPLHKACIGGHLSTVNLLIGYKGIPYEAKNKEGLTPILLAVKLEHYTIAKALSDYGVELIKKDSKGRSILHLLLDRKTLTPEALQFFEEIIRLNPDLIRMRDDGDHTPLHIAAKWGHVSIITPLLSHIKGKEDRNLNYLWKQDSQGRTAFQIALDRGFPQFESTLRNFDRTLLGSAYSAALA